MTCRIGVFICDCKGLISDHIDSDILVNQSSALPDVAMVERIALLCSEENLDGALRRFKDAGCNRLLLAGCSPRSSLKFPEEKIERMLQSYGFHPEFFEVANIREQCAWQHPDRAGATSKAVDLIRMAHVRLESAEPAPGPASIVKRALVVGAGPSGLQAAKDLASMDVEVTLAERNPWIGGRLCQLPRIFQTEGWPSVCDSACVGPVQAKGAILGEGIKVRTQTEVQSAEKKNGSFRVTLRSEPAYVDEELCISCGACAKVCPEETIRRFDQGLTKRKAIDKEFERALPDFYTILSDACTKCGDCLPVCPTGAIHLEAEAQTVTEEFGAVFLATGFDPVDLGGYPNLAKDHPNVVTGIEFERLMDGGLRRPSDGKKPESVVWIQCAGSRAGPERRGAGVDYCSKTCCAVTAKQVDRLMAADPMVEPRVIYYRDMRTYERALETLYQRLRISGVEFINGDVRSISGNGDGHLKLSVAPIGSEEEEIPEISMDADLVVLAAAQIPSSGSGRLYRMFGVETDRYGYPVENQPRVFRPTESLVSRAYVLGASAGPKVIQQAAEQGSTAAMHALPALLSGYAAAPKYASRINPDRCTRCRTCESVCPHGAIRMTPEGAVSDPAFCQACGFCAAACPVHAAELTNFSDRQIVEQARVAFRELPPGEPKILALLCYWCSYSAADFVGIERVAAPENYRVVRTRCSSSVNTALLMEMFRLGVDGILVAGCPERSCHHLWGNFVADKRIELARALMDQLGLNSSRLRFEYIGAPMQAKLMETLQSMDRKLRQLGPNPAAIVEGVPYAAYDARADA
jgi:heterodisulfide reductase subunit A